MRPLYLHALSIALMAASTGCTVFDGLTVGKDANGNPIVDGAGKGLGNVAASGKCTTNADCTSAYCNAGACEVATTTDGVQNGSETDVDCGGPDAPKCDASKTCVAATDCFWGYCTGGTCEGHQAGRKDGDQTDIDCGGTRSPACDWGLGCAADTDCTSAACSKDKKCLTGPSCKAENGGTSCGTGETGEADAKHEECCRSLPVAGATDPTGAGKKVFVDKYEITAGRMRAFLAAVAAKNAGTPNVKGWIEANKPAGWKTGWSDILPTAQRAGDFTFTVTTPTQDPFYPGDDVYRLTATQGTSWRINSGTYTIGTSVVFAFGGVVYYPEFFATGTDPSYAAYHNFNCNTQPGSYGFPTYWLPPEEVTASDPQSLARSFTQAQLDEKSLNCTPNALFAAFCAWDGGMLMTQNAFDTVTGGTWRDNRGTDAPTVPESVARGALECGGNNTLNTASDTTNDCRLVPEVNLPVSDSRSDAANRVTAPGRIAADAVRMDGVDEPWMDLIGNLQESVVLSNGTFGGRGFGIGWQSALHHRLQMSLPRGREASFGARCMRVK